MKDGIRYFGGCHAWRRLVGHRPRNISEQRLSFDEIDAIFKVSKVDVEGVMHFPCAECGGKIVDGLTHPSMQKVLVRHFNYLTTERLKHVIKTVIEDKHEG